MLSDRERKLLRMRDLLEHMADCHDQWAWSNEADPGVLADLMLRDLEQIKRICVSLSTSSSDPVSRGLLAAVGS
jgi:hypothetical protein